MAQIGGVSLKRNSRGRIVSTRATFDTESQVASLLDTETIDGRSRGDISRSTLDQVEDALSTKWRIVEGLSITVATLMLALALIVNGFAAFGGSDIRKFGMQFNTSALSAWYPTEITPPGLTFSVIWAIIYLWQIVWIAYSITYVCRPRAARTIKLGVYWMYSFANTCNIVWIYLFGNDYTEGALCFIILLFLSLLITSGLAAYDTYSVLKVPCLSKPHLWLTRILVHNGLAFYTAWISIAWLLNVAIVADQRQSGPLNAENAGTLVLSILGAEIFLWFILQHIFLHKFVRWIQVEYVVFLAALVSIVWLHWSITTDRNKYFGLALLIMTGFLQVARIPMCFIIWYCSRLNKKRETYDTL